MDETYEPILPDTNTNTDTDTELEPIPVSKPKSADPPPLPRLWKTPPEEEAVETLPSPKRNARSGKEVASAPAPPPKKKKKKVEEVVDDGTGATKLEETPVLDTYEARQTVRWIIGGILATLFVIGLIVILKAVKGNGNNEESRDADTTEVRPSETRSSDEKQARLMIDNAKKADDNGRSSAALEMLNRLVKAYPGTAAAREAQVAIDRSKHDLPLFGEEAVILATKPKTPAPGTSTATGPTPSKNEAATNASPGNTPVVAPPSQPPVNIPPPAPIPIHKPLPSGYRPRFEFPIHGSGWPTRIVCDRDGADLVLVPQATFLMGRDDGEPDEGSSGPAHQVFVSTFYIDLHEVTAGQYLHFLKETGRPFDAAKFSQRNPVAVEDMPVVGVSFKEATAYCTWADRHLPTEAQWELAARGPGQGRVSYWFGELPRKDPIKGPRTMERVMTLPTDVSPYGAFDLAANAWEWTSEFYDSRYYKSFRALAIDPTGPRESPATLEKITVKGGSKSGFLTWREGVKKVDKLPYLGFRGALPVEGKPIEPPAPKTPINLGQPNGGVNQPF